MIHGKYIGQGGDLSEVKALREEIFGSGMAESYDLHEEADPMALNAVIDEDGKNVGTGRLVFDIIEDKFYVDNIGILEEYRGKQYGEFTLRMLADKADQCLAKEIWAEVPKSAENFFKRLFFKPLGNNGDMITMNAQIADFHTCCSSEKKGPDCASCGGCNGR